MSYAAAESSAALRRKVVGGLGWKALSQISLQVSRLVVGIALARLLTPAQFGLAGMVIVFSGMAVVFTDLALGAALVQRTTITEEDRSTVFWTTVGVGAVFTGIAVAASVPLSRFYGQPMVAPLFAAASIGFLLTAVSSTQASLLTREMDFRSLEIRQIAGTVFGGLVAIVAALLGAGAWALILQGLANAALSTVLLWTFSPWKPRLIFSKASLRELTPFGMRVFGARFFQYANGNVDNLLVGRFLGSAALGTYSVAYNLMLAPAFRIISPIQAVLFPAFARLQNDVARLRQTWLLGNAIICAVMLPAFAGLLVVAPDFVPTVLGHRWRPAVPVLELLSVAGIAQSMQSLNYGVLQASGAAKQLLRYSGLSSIVTVGGFVVGLHWGVVGVAGSFAVARLVLLVPYTAITGTVTRVSFAAFWRSTWRVIAAATVMSGCVLCIRLGFGAAHVPAAVRLCLEIFVGFGSYLALLRWIAPDLVEAAIRFVGRKGQPDAPGEGEKPQSAGARSLLARAVEIAPGMSRSPSPRENDALEEASRDKDAPPKTIISPALRW